ncbi:hypothetical protein QDR37_02025 [Amnibacterium sp. CER49]|uniref:hypothetical protein n=1 Tax=Amnibacterium sp. CER49 TaxID=3039161 RepID=UPI0024476955|nr:hypothetical protein [Amnibacterium sp. CER49]MDH2442714.1 hypothetical protein [Amnibacterium sp. CER49]
MRFVLALVTFVVAAVLIGLGIAQRTVLLPQDHTTVRAGVPAGVRYVVVPGSVLNAHPGQQQLHLAGSSKVFAAYGRQADVTAWLSGQRYATLRVDAAGKALPPVVSTAPVVAGLTGGHPDPNGSDLWVDQQAATGRLDWNVKVPSGVAVLVAADGTAAAPSTIALSWPVRVATPLATPLIIGGSVLAVVGLLLYIWALVHLRRRRGPRRRPPAKLPRAPHPRVHTTRPQLVATAKGRRAVRRTALIASVATGAVLLTGCQSTSRPVLVAATSGVHVTAAAVTEEQATRIVASAAETAQLADRRLSAWTLRNRFDGPALVLRRAAYLVKQKDPRSALPQAIPVAPDALVNVILPETTAAWPRTLFAVVSSRSAPRKVAPVALTLVQATPRDGYKVRDEMSLLPTTVLPSLPSVTAGASRLQPDTGLLRVAPRELAADYGRLLRWAHPKESALFDTSSDALLQAVGTAAKKKAVDALGGTAGITFTDVTPDPADVVALATADSGAIVAVDLAETWTVKPSKDGVKVTPSGATKILSKVDSTTKGIASTYGYQLLFSVPSAASSERVVLLGYAQGLISAKEL